MGPVFTNRDICLMIAIAPFAFIIFGPYVGVKLAAQKSWDIITGKKPPQPYKRPPLLPRRPLTPPLQPDSGWDQRQGQSQGEHESKRECEAKRNTKDQSTPSYYTQAQSILFSLPPEIRALIYREILSFPIPLRVQLGPPLYTDRKERRYNRDCSWTVIGLLACCRRVYSESIHLLYETNVLDFLICEISASILKLPTYIIPSRLQGFRSLKLHILLHVTNVDHLRDIWLRSCDVLRTLTGLQSLLVDFQCQDGVVDLDPFLEAMAGIRASRFKVYVRRGLSVQGGPNHKVFPSGAPFELFRLNSKNKWTRWVWQSSSVL
ncbi:hypothetical protein FE257_007527 [Aspergillus nanangensis]|uniref:DUF7730 domain-containing protein n=1 Tax=Aspergillus nanangensis TaxID=2582783 RepID=A0AAD4GT64_ASPNN|nr:hypothetical protein FE257_007527 [Aspergillus nanangensis]